MRRGSRGLLACFSRRNLSVSFSFSSSSMLADAVMKLSSSTARLTWGSKRVGARGKASSIAGKKDTDRNKETKLREPQGDLFNLKLNKNL